MTLVMLNCPKMAGEHLSISTTELKGAQIRYSWYFEHQTSLLACKYL
jgi:hypothetical protein